MFPEYRDLITRLKAENKTFARLFDEHNDLDQRVKNIEAHIVPGTDSEVENLKKQKLQLKDRLYDMLKEASVARLCAPRSRALPAASLRTTLDAQSPGKRSKMPRFRYPLRVPRHEHPQPHRAAVACRHAEIHALRLAYGADAVYAGQPRYSLRVRNNEFDHANLKVGIDEAHALGKQFYVVVNIAPHNAKLKTFIKDLGAGGGDGPGRAGSCPTWPDHAGAPAFSAADHPPLGTGQRGELGDGEVLGSQGVSPVILSRELSLEEIGEIREQVPGMELEVFVHGALCMAYSGRCLLSGYINKRDPNRAPAPMPAAGNTRPTRPRRTNWATRFTSTSPSPCSRSRRRATRPWASERPPTRCSCSRMSARRRVHGGDRGRARHLHHELKDLRAVQHVERLVQMGVHSLKIEGRTKSHYYVARTAQVYRKAIDDALAGRPFDKSLMDTLESLAHRGYTEGFLRRHVHDEYQNYERGFALRAPAVRRRADRRAAQRPAEVKVKTASRSATGWS